MAPGSYAQWSSCVNPPVNLTGEQDELAGQGSVQKFNIKSNKAPTKALTPLKAPTPPLVPSSTEDLFTKFIKVFMETTQAQMQAQAELQEQPFKARFPKIYLGKSHICQQCEDHFKTSGATGMNCIPFAALFFYGIISF